MCTCCNESCCALMKPRGKAPAPPTFPSVPPFLLTLFSLCCIFPLVLDPSHGRVPPLPSNQPCEVYCAILHHAIKVSHQSLANSSPLSTPPDLLDAALLVYNRSTQALLIIRIGVTSENHTMTSQSICGSRSEICQPHTPLSDADSKRFKGCHCFGNLRFTTKRFK